MSNLMDTAMSHVLTRIPEGEAHLYRERGGALAKEKSVPKVLVLKFLNLLGVRTSEKVLAGFFNRVVRDEKGQVRDTFAGAIALSGDIDEQIQALKGVQGVKTINSMLEMANAAERIAGVAFRDDAISAASYGSFLATLRHKLEARKNILMTVLEGINAQLVEGFVDSITNTVLPEFFLEFSNPEELKKVENFLTRKLKKETESVESKVPNAIAQFGRDRVGHNPTIHIGGEVLTDCVDLASDLAKFNRLIGVQAGSDWSKAAQFLATQVIPLQFVNAISTNIMLEAAQLDKGVGFPNLRNVSDEAIVILTPVQNEAGKLVKMHAQFLYDMSFVFKRSDGTHTFLQNGFRFVQDIDLVQTNDGFEFENYQVRYEAL